MLTKKILIAALMFNACINAAQAACPSSHFQPTTNFGSAFGGARAITEYSPLRADEELAFQFIEYQSPDPGYARIYAASIIRADSGKYRIALVRARASDSKDKANALTVESRELPAELSARLLTVVTPALKDTHYPTNPCEVNWTDGYVVQALVADVPGLGNIGGEVFVPPELSPAGAVVALGRSLRDFATGRGEILDVESKVKSVEGVHPRN